MKKIFLIAVFMFALMMSSCDLFRDLKDEFTEVEPNNIEDLIDEYISGTETNDVAE